MRTPSSARPACPHGFADGRGNPLAVADFAAGFFAASLTAFFAGFAFVRALDFAFFTFLRVAIGSLSCFIRFVRHAG